MTIDEARGLFDRRRRAWLAADLDAYLACFAEDLVFASPVHDPPLVGRPAFEALVRRSHAALEPRRFDVHALAVDGDDVLAEWTIEGRARGGDGVVRWRGMSVARYRDGRIATWREYWNPADVGLAAPVARP